MGRFAGTTSAPRRVAKHWCPRQTPSTGMRPRTARKIDRLYEASRGCPGPGEMTTAEGSRSMSSWAGRESARWTTQFAPNAPKSCARLNVKESWLSTTRINAREVRANPKESRSVAVHGSTQVDRALRSALRRSGPRVSRSIVRRRIDEGVSMRAATRGVCASGRHDAPRRTPRIRTLVRSRPRWFGRRSLRLDGARRRDAQGVRDD